MQKKLIALAIAGLSSAAFAQSNVTIYGVADVSFENAKATGAAAAGGNRNSFARVNANSSYIGFKGTEALGNGMSAVFQMESGVAMDTAGGALAGGRDTYVGLTGGFGTVIGGLISGPTRGLAARMDMNAGATMPGANSSIVGKPVGGAGAGILDSRLANAVAYVSPNFNGFTAVIGFAAGENRTLDGAAATASLNQKAWDLGLNYANGPIDIGYAHAEIDRGATDTSTVVLATTSNTAAPGNVTGAKEWSNDRLAGSYTFGGGHKVAVLWDKSKADIAGAVTSKRTTWGLGGKFMVTANGGLIAQYYKAAKQKLNTGDVADSDAKLWEIGYEHALSKRTMLKATYAKIRNSAAASYDFNVGALAVAGSVPTAGADPQAISVGIRHSF